VRERAYLFSDVIKRRPTSAAEYLFLFLFGGRKVAFWKGGISFFFFFLCVFARFMNFMISRWRWKLYLLLHCAGRIYSPVANAR
jgi:hypothetical protein